MTNMEETSRLAAAPNLLVSGGSRFVRSSGRGLVPDLIEFA
jgi:hypothetical protein